MHKDQGRQIQVNESGTFTIHSLTDSIDRVDEDKIRTSIGAPGRNRTYDLRFRKPSLYPLSYGGFAPTG